VRRIVQRVRDVRSHVAPLRSAMWAMRSANLSKSQDVCSSSAAGMGLGERLRLNPKHSARSLRGPLKRPASGPLRGA
jgi:hypothetical protein